MRPEDTIRVAEHDAMDAAKILSEYYLERGDTGSALRYLHFMARGGDMAAARTAVELSRPLAEACERTEDWEGAITNWGHFARCLFYQLKSRDCSAKERAAGLREFNYATYRQAIACRRLEQTDSKAVL